MFTIEKLHPIYTANAISAFLCHMVFHDLHLFVYYKEVCCSRGCAMNKVTLDLAPKW